jgi:hypothetical protein
VLQRVSTLGAGVLDTNNDSERGWFVDRVTHTANIHGPVEQPGGSQNWLAWFIISVSTVHKNGIFSSEAGSKQLVKTLIWNVKRQHPMLN